MLLHVLTLPLAQALPDPLARVMILLMAVGFAGTAISAVSLSSGIPLRR